MDQTQKRNHSFTYNCKILLPVFNFLSSLPLELDLTVQKTQKVVSWTIQNKTDVSTKKNSKICCIALHILQTSKGFWVFLFNHFSKGGNKQNRSKSSNHKSQTMNFDFPKKANPRLRFKTQKLDLIYTLHVSIHN